MEAAPTFSRAATLELWCAEKQETFPHSLVLRPVAYVVHHLSIELRQIWYVAVNVYFTGCSGKIIFICIDLPYSLHQKAIELIVGKCFSE